VKEFAGHRTVPEKFYGELRRGGMHHIRGDDSGLNQKHFPIYGLDQLRGSCRQLEDMRILGRRHHPIRGRRGKTNHWFERRKEKSPRDRIGRGEAAQKTSFGSSRGAKPDALGGKNESIISKEEERQDY